MNTKDATFNQDTSSSATNNEESAVIQKITDRLSENYNWIRFVAIIELIFATIDIITSIGLIIVNPLILLHSIFLFISAYYLLKASNAIKQAYEYNSFKYTKNSLILLGKYFMMSSIALILSIITIILF